MRSSFFTRTLVFCTVALLGAGCSDGGPTAPAGPRFAEIAGTYDVSAPITELPGARLTGTLSLTDDSRETPAFSGSYALQLLAPDGSVAGSFTGPVVSGTLTEAGSVSFNLDDNDFRWSGTLNGRAISGTWVISDGSSTYTGTFTASRR